MSNDNTEMDPVAVALLEIKQGMDTGFRELRGDMETLKSEGQRTNLRLTRQEVRMDDVETRIGRTSLRVSQDSEHDLSRDAKLAEVIVWQRGVDTALAETATKKDLDAVTASQTAAILAGFDSLKKSPYLKMLATAVIAALSTWLATKGIHIK